MNYIKRSLERKFLKMSGAFKAVMVTGARQVGKSTMLKHLAEGTGRVCVSMDDADVRELAQRDPKLFFQMYRPPILIDEAQKAPALFEQIKILCDASDERGRFWLTGSQSKKLMKQAGDSLAGRIGLLKMYSLSAKEISGKPDDIPEDFWRSFYNIGSGEQYRITNFEFEELLLDTIGLGDPRKLFEPHWFITRNFHGQWYTDSDKLEEFLHFRHNVPLRQYFKKLGDQAPKYFKLAVLAKPFAKLVGKIGIEPLTRTKTYGTMSWIGDHVEDRISAYYGSIEDWEKIPGWNEFRIIRPSETPAYLDHGYDETKPLSELDLDDMKKAAAFRGGECLSESMEKGDLFTPLKWRSARGNEFTMTPNLVLRGGHWCPDELPMPWDYDTEARINPFFAQVWYPLHDKHENNFYDKTIYKGYAGYDKL